MNHSMDHLEAVREGISQPAGRHEEEFRFIENYFMASQGWTL
jgi:hypothetical protein